MSHLEVNGLSKEYPTPAGPLTVLSHISLSLEKGENLAVLGPSGSGKSTFLHIVGALDTPTNGTVRLDGVNPFELSQKDLALFRNQKIGFIFQEHHLLPQLSALENVVLPILAKGRVTQADSEFGTQLLERVGLADRSHHLPSELSGGERQRVAVARSLSCRPTLLLADEPTGSLDQNNAETIGKLLLEVQVQSGATLICVTHSIALAEMFNRAVRLQKGQLVN